MAGQDSNPCERCGRPHLTPQGKPSCTGHRSKNHPTDPGGPCAKNPLAGQKVCRTHGGAAGHAKAAGERRRAEAKIAALAASLGDVEDIDRRDPADIIADQIAWRSAHVRWLRTQAMAIDPKRLTWGKTKRKVGGDDHGITSEAKPNIWYQMYIDASRDLEKLCIEAIRAGLEERRVKLAERQADAIVTMLDGLLAELGIDPKDPKTAATVGRHLRAVGE